MQERHFFRKWRPLIQKMTTTEREKLIKTLTADEVDVLAHDWAIWARDGQWPPSGAWRVWLGVQVMLLGMLAMATIVLWASGK